MVHLNAQNCESSFIHSTLHYCKGVARGGLQGALRPQHLFTFDFDDLNLRNLAKLCFFKLIMTKSYFIK